MKKGIAEGSGCKSHLRLRPPRIVGADAEAPVGRCQLGPDADDPLPNRGGLKVHSD
jgi:hypothetical protein